MGYHPQHNLKAGRGDRSIVAVVYCSSKSNCLERHRMFRSTARHTCDCGNSTKNMAVQVGLTSRRESLSYLLRVSHSSDLGALRPPLRTHHPVLRSFKGRTDEFPRHIISFIAHFTHALFFFRHTYTRAIEIFTGHTLRAELVQQLINHPPLMPSIFKLMPMIRWI
jgi:hypothetical protein